MQGLQTTVGVTSGNAFCGRIGGDTRCEYGVMGPSVNLAARLMSSCRSLGADVLCDEEVRRGQKPVVSSEQPVAPIVSATATTSASKSASKSAAKFDSSFASAATTTTAPTITFTSATLTAFTAAARQPHRHHCHRNHSHHPTRSHTRKAATNSNTTATGAPQSPHRPNATATTTTASQLPPPTPSITGSCPLTRRLSLSFEDLVTLRFRSLLLRPSP